MGDNRPDSPGALRATVLRDLVEWARSRPVWQQDALRRLWQKGELTAGDLDELEVMCKAPHGVLSAEETVPTPQPLDASHIPAGGGSGVPVSLCRISDVRHVNALAPNQALKFHPSGLTIVYGRNASGKSGYVRILKKACRARASTDPILPNAYADPPTEPASAAIEFELEGTRTLVAWSEGQAVDEALSFISVFDSACASIHIEKTNDVAYTPAALSVLRQLGDACRTLKDRLQAMADQVREMKPGSLLDPKCRDHTQVGRLIRSLSGGTNPEDIGALATFDEAERRRLEQLRADLAKDPVRAAQELTAQKTRLIRTIAQVQRIEGLLSDSAITTYGTLLDDAHSKAEAARVAATELFKDEPLPHIGSDIWRVLWEAARKYSEEEAYPGHTYPHIGDGARCVLCQQELSREAASRLMRFEDCVKANAQKVAEEAAQKVKTRREEVESLDLGSATCREMLAQLRDELGEAGTTRKLSAFLRRARWRKGRVLKTKDGSDLTKVPTWVDLPVSDLARVQSGLEARIAELQQAARSTDRRAQELQLHELEDRVWLSGVLEEVRTEIKRLARLDAINKSIRDTDTHGISQKSNDVAQALVTQALRDRFAEELRHLDMDHLQASMVTEGSRYGVPQFRISLATRVDVKTGEILSEGERRCVALAAFLSELATTENRSGIVFDDPVCSLDHDYRKAFANRLVDECRQRQVIVFTHDLVFVFQLVRAAEKAHACRYYQYVSRNDTMIGLCGSDLPFKARPLSEAVESLERRAKKAREIYEVGQTATWQDKASDLFGRIREAWELAVEEAVSPVFRRFEEGVDTKGLRLLTVITDADCKAVDAARGRCSTLQHSASAAADEKPPTPDDLDREIAVLKKWAEDVHAKQQQAK